MAGSYEDGLTAYQGRDYETAARFWGPLAEQGHTGAQNNLGEMYRDGLGVEQDDAEALIWFRRAAGQGDAGGQNNLGEMYGDGLGVEQDDAEALVWFRRAADQGDAGGQNNLGKMYKEGYRDGLDAYQRGVYETAAQYWGPLA